MEIKTAVIGLGALAAGIGFYKGMKFLLREPQMTDEMWEARDFDPTSAWDLGNHPFYERWKEVPQTYETFQKVCDRAREYLKIKFFPKRKVLTIDDLSQRELALLDLISLEDAMVKAIEYHPEEICEELGIPCNFNLDYNGKVYFNFSLDLDEEKQNNPSRFEEAKRNKADHNFNVKERRKMVRQFCTTAIEAMMCCKDTSKLTVEIFESDAGKFDFSSIDDEVVNALYINASKFQSRYIQDQVKDSAKNTLRTLFK